MLVNFDKDNISDRVLNKIGKYVSQADFTPDIIGRVSGAAKSLCMWVRAMEMYGRIYRVVEPKKLKLNTALSQHNTSRVPVDLTNGTACS
uniref:Dynein heavy chain coiled coil stalk domain-containing protein n=1 Tax=Octopus bimaculoides TaxID=37653 RepID=A0A0L8GF05_OCTBM